MNTTVCTVYGPGIEDALVVRSLLKMAEAANRDHRATAHEQLDDFAVADAKDSEYFSRLPPFLQEQNYAVRTIEGNRVKVLKVELEPRA